MKVQKLLFNHKSHGIARIFVVGKRTMVIQNSIFKQALIGSKDLWQKNLLIYFDYSYFLQQ